GGSMASSTLTTVHGRAASLGAGAVDALAARLRGTVVRPGDADFDSVRAIWNGMIDRCPGLIVRAAGADDVVEAVRFAAEHELLISIRGAGHNIAGNAVCEGGLMIDLSLMKRVEVDAARRLARAEPGVTLGELDRATQEHGLATPVGINSTTGIAGLTLGGGF